MQCKRHPILQPYTLEIQPQPDPTTPSRRWVFYYQNFSDGLFCLVGLCEIELVTERHQLPISERPGGAGSGLRRACFRARGADFMNLRLQSQSDRVTPGCPRGPCTSLPVPTYCAHTHSAGRYTEGQTSSMPCGFHRRRLAQWESG